MMRNMKRMWVAMAVAGFGAVGSFGAEVDASLPDYKPVEGVTGNIKSIGSDSMNNLMTLWAEGFKKMYPNVQVEIEG